MTEDWEELLDEAKKKPIWVGDLPLGNGLSSLWWKAWDTGRMDVGVRAMVSRKPGTRLEWLDPDEAAAMQRGLVTGMVGSLVAPSLEKAVGDWSAEVKMPAVSEGAGTIWTVSGKVIVRCSIARELELLMNGVNRFALESGWDGLTATERRKR